MGIAIRTAVLNIIPGWFTDKLMNTAIEVVKENSSFRKDVIIEWFGNQHHISKDRLFSYLSVESDAEIVDDKIVDLMGLYNSIKNGDVSIYDVFEIEMKQPQEVTDLLNMRKPRS